MPPLNWLVIALPLFASLTWAQQSLGQPSAHPQLVMTPSDVAQIRTKLGQVPLFDSSLTRVRAEVDAEMKLGIDTPEPQDYSGGYTHERHKKNYAMAQKAGALYQILGDEKYARYVRDMLVQYATMYRNLPLHPKPRSYARGKLFWQCLNDANWLVYMSQAYDAIYEYLPSSERETLETELFRPFADHISIASPQFFNRIHNHSTWGTAAVGMIGLVMHDEELIQRALYGLDLDNFGNARDNDGGFIRQRGEAAGFFANLDSAFSPDGYYTEGPYYQRYAMYPFLVFAQSLRNSNFSEQAFERNDGMLLKAVETLIQLSDQDGEFFALNDAQKGMSLQANELVTAVDIAFQANQDPRLLGIAQTQQRVLLDGAGFAVAKAITSEQAQPFTKPSLHLTDGSDGVQGGLALLRAPNEALTLVFKYTSQGLSHGHYDKLSFSLHAEGAEVLQDYGMARFVNIGQKGGGNYLPENTSWAKQSIAHNTLVINETSHFEGKYEIGSKHHSTLEFFNVREKSAQVVSAREDNAYPATSMRRTMALLNMTGMDTPVVLDIMEVQSASNNQYDLPFHYLGQVISTNFANDADQQRRQLGETHGYQHLFIEGRSETKLPQPTGSNSKFTWMNENRFYTLTSVTESGDEQYFTRLGANDPNFNLRRDPMFMLRRKDTKDTIFVNSIEAHGSYSPITELAQHAVGKIAKLEVIHKSADYLAIGIETDSGNKSMFFLSRKSSGGESHQLEIAGKQVSWSGPYYFIKVAN